MKIDVNQPHTAYEKLEDPAHKDFRLYHYVVADQQDEAQVERLKDPDNLYRVSRSLDVQKPLQSIVAQGPAYCRVYLIRKGTLFFINEGEMSEKGVQLLKDLHGEYRFGTRLEREGLLIHFADSILHPNMKANFLAVLLRAIPNCFDLDDSELRIVQNVHLYPPYEREHIKSSFSFIYGHDESGLVPFERIFEKFSDMLKKALQTLVECPSCNGEGCYICLFSLNSRYLSGTISRHIATEYLNAYLKQSRLKPYIVLDEDEHFTQPDRIMTLSLKGNGCQCL